MSGHSKWATIKHKKGAADKARGKLFAKLARQLEVAAKAGDSLYGRMALLGKADTQSKAGQVDQAIASWKQLADQKGANIPEDAVLIELGKAYQAKGNADDARKAFTTLVEQHPTSPYVAAARVELEALKN